MSCSFPSLAIFAALANSGSRAVTIPDSLWLHRGRLRGMFAYDDAKRRITFNEREWSVKVPASTTSDAGESGSHSPSTPQSANGPLYASREDELEEQELRRRAYEHFVLQGDDSCDAVAVLVYERAPVLSNGSSQKARLLVDFLGAERLATFLKCPLADQDLLLCRYMGPGIGYWSVVQCVWTDNRLIAVERRANRHPLEAQHIPIETRFCTTAAKPEENQPVPVPPGTQARLAKLCAAVAAAVNHGAFEPPSGAERLGLYFYSNVPFGSTAKPGRWVFLGANEAPLPHPEGTTFALRSVIHHLLADAAACRGTEPKKTSAESVEWVVESESPAGYFKPARRAATPAVDRHSSPTPHLKLDNGSRRVKPKRSLPIIPRTKKMMTPPTSTNSVKAMEHFYSPPISRETLAAELSRSCSDPFILSEAEWQSAVLDASMFGYLVAPPFTRSLSSLRTTAVDGTPLLTRNVDPSAVQGTRPFSSQSCLSSKALRRARIEPHGLPRSEVLCIGHSVFKPTFMDRVLQAMDDQEHQPSSPQPVLPKPTSTLPMPSPRSVIEPTPDALVAAPSKSRPAAERVTLKRRELLARYNPMKMLDVVLDGLYNVYDASLQDPTPSKNAALLSKPSNTNVIAKIGDLNSTITPTTITGVVDESELARSLIQSTVEVQLLPLVRPMQNELVAMLRDVGVPVRTERDARPKAVCDWDSSTEPVVLVALFPSSNDAASRVRVRLQKLCAALDAHIRSMTLADIVAAQREVVENGDGHFHNVLMQQLNHRARQGESSITTAP